jgi:hypothetical protein
MNIRKLLKLGIVATVALVSTATWAAEQAQPAPAGATAVAHPPGPQRPPVFNISFPGGTLEEFVAYVEKRFDASVRDTPKPNLIVPADAKSVRMPKLELRSVDMTTLISATTMLLQPEHLWQQVATGSGYKPDSSTWVLVSRADVRKTQAYYIGHLLKKFKVGDITTALETVWQMGSTAKTELKYHEDTQMLIIRADKNQITMAEDVLTQLNKAVGGDEVERASRLAQEAAEAIKKSPKPGKSQ